MRSTFASRTLGPADSAERAWKRVSGVITAVAALAMTGVFCAGAYAGCNDGPSGSTDANPNVGWSFKDSVSACPAGASVVAGHPARLRMLVFYQDSNCNPRVGVPPESLVITWGTLSGNAVINDASSLGIYADDSTDANGQARFTFGSLSGCGTLQLALNVSGADIGTRDVKIRTVDSTGDGRDDSADQLVGSQCDINWDGTHNPVDRDTVLVHPDHWHRHALHGTLVKRTSLCDYCDGVGLNTVSAEGRVSWSPSGRKIAYSIHDPLSRGFAISTSCLPILPAGTRRANSPSKVFRRFRRGCGSLFSAPPPCSVRSERLRSTRIDPGNESSDRGTSGRRACALRA